MHPSGITSRLCSVAIGIPAACLSTVARALATNNVPRRWGPSGSASKARPHIAVLREKLCIVGSGPLMSGTTATATATPGMVSSSCVGASSVVPDNRAPERAP